MVKNDISDAKMYILEPDGSYTVFGKVEDFEYTYSDSSDTPPYMSLSNLSDCINRRDRTFASPHYDVKYSMIPQFLNDENKSYINNDVEITKEVTKKMLNDRYGRCNAYPKAKKVYYDEAAGVTVVLWTDNTKTIVKAAEGDKHDAYLGYCTALAKKIHGTNSALKRDLEKVLVKVEKKEKKNDA